MVARSGREGIVGIHHVNFSVEDLDRTVDFYTNLLGFELRSRGQYRGDLMVAADLLGELHKDETKDGVLAEIAVLELNGTRVEFMQWLTPKSMPYHRDASIAGAAHLGVRVKNIREVRNRLEEAGVVFRSPVDHVHEEVGYRPWQWCALQDPDGIIVELIEEQPITDLVRTLGSRVREARQARGLTLKETAEMSGISVAHLSQVERGDTVPSVPALVGISAALGVAADYFLREEIGEQPVTATAPTAGQARRGSLAANKAVQVSAADARHVLSVAGGTEWHWLTEQDAPLRAVRTRWEVGAHSEEMGFGQAGTEMVVVLEGTLKVEVESQSQVIEAGGSITFDRSSRRRFSNVGTTPVVALCVVAETSTS